MVFLVLQILAQMAEGGIPEKGYQVFQCIFAILHRLPYYDLTLQIIKVSDLGPLRAFLWRHCADWAKVKVMCNRDPVR